MILARATMARAANPTSRSIIHIAVDGAFGENLRDEAGFGIDLICQYWPGLRSHRLAADQPLPFAGVFSLTWALTFFA